MKYAQTFIASEQNDTQYQQQAKKINSKIYKNTKNNADLDNRCGKEHLYRAKKAREDENKQLETEETKLAARNLIDSAEKYAKANAIIHDEEYNKYKNKHNTLGKEELVLRTHDFSVIRQTPSNSKIISEEDAEKLDKYADAEHNLYSSHTSLAYGDVQPELDDVEEISEFTSRLKEQVEKKEREIAGKKHTKDIADLIDKFMTS